MVSTIVLIGPAAVGKSTIAPLLARRLGRHAVDLDAEAAPYYEEAGQPLSALRTEMARRGYPAAAKWWQPARVHAAVRILEDHPGKVIAFGAGHSHFEDRTAFDVVRDALVGTTVILLLPYRDPVRSLEVLRERSTATKGHAWIRDGVDYLHEWITSAQNRELATFVTEVGGLDPDQATEEVYEVLRSAGRAGVIDAAGGLIWRRNDRGIEVVLVHRPRRDDWTLPIGRLEPGESLEACALREVEEETGLECTILGFLDVLEVEADDGLHRFHIYEMTAARGGFVPNAETDEAPWLDIDDAIERTTYANVRSLLEAASPRLGGG